MSPIIRILIKSSKQRNALLLTSHRLQTSAGMPEQQYGKGEKFWRRSLTLITNEFQSKFMAKAWRTLELSA